MLKQIEKDMMEALKNKNKEKAGALRLLISKCKNKAIEVGHELSDSEVIKVLQTAAKQHKESIRMYKEGNRDDLVEAEMNELQFVESYLPSMMSEEEVRSLVENIISEKVFIKVEKWNLYLGDAGLSRNLAIECIRNKDQGPLEAAKISLKAINVKVGDGVHSIPLINLITNSQIRELEEILESFFDD